MKKISACAATFRLLATFFLSLHLSTSLASATEVSDPIDKIAVDGVVGEVFQQPQPGFEIINLSQGVQIKIENPILNEEKLKPFNELNTDEKKEFRLHRLYFLQSVARILNWGKLVFGTGSLSARKISQIPTASLNTFRTIMYQELPSLHPLRLFDDSFSSFTDLSPEQETIRQRGLAIIQTILQAVDMKLWESAPVLARGSEIGANFIRGWNAGAILGKNGVGVQLDFGLGIGYDKSTRTVYFDVFSDVETFKENFMKMPEAIAEKIPARFRDRFIYLPYGYFSKIYRIDGYFSSRADSSGKVFFTGEAMYPPGANDVIISPGFFAVGFPAAYGLPTTPFDWFLGYKNRFVRFNIFGIAVGPNVSSWIRPDVPLLTSPVAYLKSKLFKKQGKKTPLGICRQILNH